MEFVCKKPEGCGETKPRGDFYPKGDHTKPPKPFLCLSCIRFAKIGVDDDRLVGLWSQQHWSCAICMVRLSRPDDGRIDVNKRDHDEVSVILPDTSVRGLLCVKCSMGLGQFNHNWKICERAALYLRENGDISYVDYDLELPELSQGSTK